MTFLYPYDVPGSSSNFCSIFAEHNFTRIQLSLLILWNNLAYSTNKRTKLESYELLFSAIHSIAQLLLSSRHTNLIYNLNLAPMYLILSILTIVLLIQIINILGAMVISLK